MLLFWLDWFDDNITRHHMKLAEIPERDLKAQRSRLLARGQSLPARARKLLRSDARVSGFNFESVTGDATPV